MIAANKCRVDGCDRNAAASMIRADDGRPARPWPSESLSATSTLRTPGSSRAFCISWTSGP